MINSEQLLNRYYIPVSKAMRELRLYLCGGSTPMVIPEWVKFVDDELSAAQMS